jgi:hypothetical protein
MDCLREITEQDRQLLATDTGMYPRVKASARPLGGKHPKYWIGLCQTRTGLPWKTIRQPGSAAAAQFVRKRDALEMATILGKQAILEGKAGK